MNTAFFSKYDHRLDALRLPADGGDGRSGDHWETVFRRISRHDLGRCGQPDDAANPPLHSAWSRENSTRRFRKEVRYLLINQSGPVAEFENWDDAFRFMTAHHPQGAAIVRSDERIGSLPRAAGTATTGPGCKSAPDGRAITAPKNVLVIEDEVGTLLTMTCQIKSAGHHVLIARDAAEAVETIKSARPDLIVTDINLTITGKGWDGFGVIEWLNFSFPQHGTKYIMVSSGDPEKLKPRADALGAFAFLVKPLMKEVLLTEIRRAIGDPTES